MNLALPISLTACQRFKMTQRLTDTMKWLWCVLIVYSGPTWSPVRCVTVRTPPKNPTTVEAQAKFFQDFFSVQLSPYKIEFGHVCEDPNTWEQRYEKKDYRNHRDMGKVRWGDKKGGYGEHYWDLNHAGHAGHAGDHGDENVDSPDDSSYHEDTHEPYEEPSEQVHKYDDDENRYEPEYPSKYDEPNRSKRANTKRYMKKAKDELDRLKAQEKTKTEESTKPKPVEESDAEASEEDESFEVKTKQKPQRIAKENKPEEPQAREKNHVVLILSQKERSTAESSDQMPRTKDEAKQYVPYEGGAGVRQHQYPQITPAVAPRLFLEPSTGHVVDRATGQAYVLQPIVHKPSSS